MRYLVLILSLLLSLFGGSTGRDVKIATANPEHVSDIQRNPFNPARDMALNRDLCLTTAASCSFSGAEQSGPFSVRSTNSNHRTNPSTKSTTRLMKAGKILCVHQFKPFLCAIALAVSGRLSSEKYLYSICSLRL